MTVTQQHLQEALIAAKPLITHTNQVIHPNFQFLRARIAV